MTLNEVTQQIYQWWLNDNTLHTCPENIPGLNNHCELSDCRECKLVAAQEAGIETQPAVLGIMSEGFAKTKTGLNFEEREQVEQTLCGALDMGFDSCIVTDNGTFATKKL